MADEQSPDVLVANLGVVVMEMLAEYVRDEVGIRPEMFAWVKDAPVYDDQGKVVGRVADYDVAFDETGTVDLSIRVEPIPGQTTEIEIVEQIDPPEES